MLTEPWLLIGLFIATRGTAYLVLLSRTLCDVGLSRCTSATHRSVWHRSHRENNDKRLLVPVTRQPLDVSLCCFANNRFSRFDWKG